MKTLKIILGFILAMTSLWIGCYFLGQITYNYWTAVPTFISMMVGIVAGMWVVIDGVV